eukprot:TRINITY_DN32014_c0_g1_i1.p1 TRINITY_DN32014_c0_g1~~TRINITY_DN32014_c0_g1_i1.p1  ORF type:complete len:2462 (+),score=658.83 TRINITY_DN32014_c0_g1_i1:159-7544(+)
MQEDGQEQRWGRAFDETYVDECIHAIDATAQKKLVLQAFDCALGWGRALDRELLDFMGFARFVQSAGILALVTKDDVCWLYIHASKVAAVTGYFDLVSWQVTLCTLSSMMYKGVEEDGTYDEMSLALQRFAERHLLPYKHRHQSGAAKLGDVTTSSDQYADLYWCYRDVLRALFEAYALRGRLEYAAFVKVCKDANITPELVSQNHLGIIFSDAAGRDKQGRDAITDTWELFHAISAVAVEGLRGTDVPSKVITQVGFIEYLLETKFSPQSPIGITVELPQVDKYSTPPAPVVTGVDGMSSCAITVPRGGATLKLKGANLGVRGQGLYVRIDFDGRDEATEVIHVPLEMIHKARGANIQASPDEEITVDVHIPPLGFPPEGSAGYRPDVVGVRTVQAAFEVDVSNYLPFWVTVYNGVEEARSPLLHHLFTMDLGGGGDSGNGGPGSPWGRRRTGSRKQNVLGYNQSDEGGGFAVRHLPEPPTKLSATYRECIFRKTLAPTFSAFVRQLFATAARDQDVMTIEGFASVELTFFPSFKAHELSKANLAPYDEFCDSVGQLTLPQFICVLWRSAELYRMHVAQQDGVDLSSVPDTADVLTEWFLPGEAERLFGKALSYFSRGMSRRSLHTVHAVRQPNFSADLETGAGGATSCDESPHEKARAGRTAVEAPAAAPPVQVLTPEKKPVEPTTPTQPGDAALEGSFVSGLGARALSSVVTIPREGTDAEKEEVEEDDPLNAARGNLYQQLLVNRVTKAMDLLASAEEKASAFTAAAASDFASPPSSPRRAPPALQTALSPSKGGSRSPSFQVSGRLEAEQLQQQRAMKEVRALLDGLVVEIQSMDTGEDDLRAELMRYREKEADGRSAEALQRRFSKSLQMDAAKKSVKVMRQEIDKKTDVIKRWVKSSTQHVTLLNTLSQWGELIFTQLSEVAQMATAARDKSPGLQPATEPMAAQNQRVAAVSAAAAAAGMSKDTNTQHVLHISSAESLDAIKRSVDAGKRDIRELQRVTQRMLTGKEDELGPDPDETPLDEELMDIADDVEDRLRAVAAELIDEMYTLRTEANVASQAALLTAEQEKSDLACSLSEAVSQAKHYQQALDISNSALDKAAQDRDRLKEWGRALEAQLMNRRARGLSSVGGPLSPMMEMPELHDLPVGEPKDAVPGGDSPLSIQVPQESAGESTGLAVAPMPTHLTPLMQRTRALEEINTSLTAEVNRLKVSFVERMPSSYAPPFEITSPLAPVERVDAATQTTGAGTEASGSAGAPALSATKSQKPQPKPDGKDGKRGSGSKAKTPARRPPAQSPPRSRLRITTPRGSTTDIDQSRTRPTRSQSQGHALRSEAQRNDSLSPTQPVRSRSATPSPPAPLNPAPPAPDDPVPASRPEPPPPEALPAVPPGDSPKDRNAPEEDGAFGGGWSEAGMEALAIERRHSNPAWRSGQRTSVTFADTGQASPRRASEPSTPPTSIMTHKVRSYVTSFMLDGAQGLTWSHRPEGLVVDTVAINTPAYNAGVCSGMNLIAIDGRRILSQEDIPTTVLPDPKGKDVDTRMQWEFLRRSASRTASASVNPLPNVVISVKSSLSGVMWARRDASGADTHAPFRAHHGLTGLVVGANLTTSGTGPHGLYIADVTQGSPADRIGLGKGMTLAAVDGRSRLLDSDVVNLVAVDSGMVFETEWVFVQSRPSGAGTTLELEPLKTWTTGAGGVQDPRGSGVWQRDRFLRQINEQDEAVWREVARWHPQLRKVLANLKATAVALKAIPASIKAQLDTFSADVLQSFGLGVMQHEIHTPLLSDPAASRAVLSSFLSSEHGGGTAHDGVPQLWRIGSGSMRAQAAQVGLKTVSSFVSSPRSPVRAASRASPRAEPSGAGAEGLPNSPPETSVMQGLQLLPHHPDMSLREWVVYLRDKVCEVLANEVQALDVIVAHERDLRRRSARALARKVFLRIQTRVLRKAVKDGRYPPLVLDAYRARYDVARAERKAARAEHVDTCSKLEAIFFTHTTASLLMMPYSQRTDRGVSFHDDRTERVDVPPSPSGSEEPSEGTRPNTGKSRAQSIKPRPGSAQTRETAVSRDTSGEVRPVRQRSVNFNNRPSAASAREQVANFGEVIAGLSSLRDWVSPKAFHRHTASMKFRITELEEKVRRLTMLLYQQAAKVERQRGPTVVMPTLPLPGSPPHRTPGSSSGSPANGAQPAVMLSPVPAPLPVELTGGDGPLPRRPRSSSPLLLPDSAAAWRFTETEDEALTGVNGRTLIPVVFSPKHEPSTEKPMDLLRDLRKEQAKKDEAEKAKGFTALRKRLVFDGNDALPQAPSPAERHAPHPPPPARRGSGRLVKTYQFSGSPRARAAREPKHPPALPTIPLPVHPAAAMNAMTGAGARPGTNATPQRVTSAPTRPALPKAAPLATAPPRVSSLNKRGGSAAAAQAYKTISATQRAAPPGAAAQTDHVARLIRTHRDRKMHEATPPRTR